MPDPRTTLEQALSPAYRIERELGQGAMAVVYLAHDTKHDRKVALKVIRSDLTIPGAAERFSREIRLAAGLQHPHILPVHDSGDAAGILWYVMPYVEGESLRDRLNREEWLPVAEAVRITREAAQALEHAHQHGVIHRDIKPENLLLSRDGSVLVADFGIARALAGGATGGNLTEAGMSLGTPAYMAPEQAMGDRPVDGRADVYALGVVLYEMLSGGPPFTGPSGLAIVARSMTETPASLRTSRGEVTAALEATVTKALARNPEERFASAGALAAALDGAKVSGTPRRISWVALAVIAVVLVAGLLVLRRPRGGEAAGIPLAVLPFENRGAADDAYFADGIADELRGKLAGLTGFRVTARASSDQYRGSPKSPKQIGRELGVTYLLSATVRWAKSPDGTSRVQVMPSLVNAETGAITWQAPFEASLTDIFAVQAGIAGQVAGALGAVLGAGEQRGLAVAPTASLAAYDLYLRAAANPGNAPAARRSKIALLEQVVGLDSTFGRAWADLSLNLSSLYENGAPDAGVAASDLAAAERAIGLMPIRPDGYNALAEYHYGITRDAQRADSAVQQALKYAPYDPNVLQTAAKIARQNGRFEEALGSLTRSHQLNPRALGVLNVMQTTLLWLRQYPEALAISDTLLARRPGDLSFAQDKAMTYLAQGDLASARALIAGLAAQHADSEVAAYFSYYWDLYWVLDDAQQRRVLTLGDDLFDGDRAGRSTTLMQLAWLRGDTVRARAWADTSYRGNLKQLEAAPQDAQRRVQVGLALAYLGRKAEAIREGEAGLKLSPLATDKINGPYYQHLVARIYLLVGEKEKAVELLEPLLQTPYYLSPAWLRLDPTFAALQGNARYERLIR